MADDFRIPPPGEVPVAVYEEILEMGKAAALLLANLAARDGSPATNDHQRRVLVESAAIQAFSIIAEVSGRSGAQIAARLRAVADEVDSGRAQERGSLVQGEREARKVQTAARAKGQVG